MLQKHLSTQFDSELNTVNAKVMEMGGIVERQVYQAIRALSTMDIALADEVIHNESQVNAFEVSVDQSVSSIISRRQPTARDLRLLIAVSKISGNLERAGDEAKRIARMSKMIIQQDSRNKLPTSELDIASDLATKLIRKSLDTFARLDVQGALSILAEDDLIDREFRDFVRLLITYMMEDPKQISLGLNLLFLAKAIERIGDHAKNIAEQIIYIVEGADVRHTTLEKIQSTVK